MSRVRRPFVAAGRVTTGLIAALVAALPPAAASADTVWLRSGQAANALERPNVRVEKIENNVLHFRSEQSDRVTERPLDEVVRIAADGETVFNQAEEAFAAGNWDQSAAAYQRALGSSNKQWIKDRAGLRLLTAAEKSGKFSTAVSGWVALLGRDPGLASKYRPQVPGDKPGTLDPAVAEVERAVNDPKLGEEQRRTLLAFQMEVARANGDAKKAQSIAARLSRESGVAGGPDPALALQLAYLALDQRQYDQVLKEINTAAPAIAEPEQQVDALYAIAEARAGLAKDDAAALKDAALAYMRAVARARSARVASPRVADALLKAAALQERLNASQEALLLYQQVAEEFKGSDAATRANQAAERLRPAAKPGGAATPSASPSDS